ncbi:MAG: hypothetical protein RXQ94_07020 [Caldivirga sp.]
MAQPQQPESPLLEQFKEQLRKLAEEAGPIKCPSRETFTAMGQLFTARYFCDEIAEIEAGHIIPYLRQAMSLTLKSALQMLYNKDGVNAFKLIPTGFLYMLYAFKQPDIAISFIVPHRNLYSDLATMLYLTVALEDYAKGFLETIEGYDVYMLFISVETEGKTDALFSFGFMNDLKENEFLPLVTKGNVTANYTGLTISNFNGATFSISPIHLDGEILDLGMFIAEAIRKSKLRLWVLKDPSLGKIFVQTV